jgi:cell wall-associated NlpC family hydrolase
MIPGGLEWMSSDEFHAGEGMPSSELLESLILPEMQRCSGARYVWGGRSFDGLDCSGFVQRVFGRAGIHLPRDARQQAQCGRLVGTPWDRNGLVFGDLLFFLGPAGAITHTAIAMGKNEIMHLTPPGWTVQGWDAPNNHLAYSFIWAKRVLSGPMNG